MSENYYNEIAWRSFPDLKVGDKISMTVTKTGFSRLLAWWRGDKITVTKMFEVKALVQGNYDLR